MPKNKKKSNFKKTRFRVELSLAEALGWGAMMLFVCGWFFILGIFVGRGLVPIPETEAVYTDYLTQVQENSAADPETPVEEKSAEQTVPDEAAPAAPEPAAPADTPEVKTPVTEKPDQVDAPADLENPGDKIFTIQVAALREKEAADQLFERLKKEEYAPYVVEVTLPGNVVWYRIRCGRYTDHDEASPVLERLRQDGYSPILVRR